MNFLELDIKILRFFNQPFSPALNLIVSVIIFSIYGYILALVYYFYRKGRKRRILHLIVSLLIGLAFVNFLKILVNRERPYAMYEDIKHVLIKPDPSFPSAHSFTALLCFYFLPKDFPRWLKLLLTIYLVFLIPIGSMYIGIHFPSDVLVGGALGFLFPKVVSESFSVKIFKKIFRLERF